MAMTESEKEKRKIERENTRFRTRIDKLFIEMGFMQYNSEGITVRIGNRKMEFDHLFSYENIVVIAEDTCGQKNKDHIRTKCETYKEICDNKKEFIDWIINTFTLESVKLKSYRLERIKPF